MKTMALTGIREMEMINVPEPSIKNDTDVIIKMKVIGVCGSDIHYYTDGKIGSQVVSYPFTVGHEGAGEIIEVGKSVTRVKPGDRVAIEPAMPCFVCDQCLSGRHNTCRSLKFLGCPGQADGLLSEYIVMPETSCIPISERINYDQAAISEPLAIGTYAVKQAVPMQNAKIGILGFGPIGMSVLIAAKAQGASEIYVTDKIGKRLEIASKCGACWTGNVDETDIVNEIIQKEPLLLDAVFECCGQQEAMDQAIDILKPGGRLMIVGIPKFGNWSVKVDMTRHKELTITNVRRQNNCVETALKMMENGLADVSAMPTHRYDFENTKKAFDLVAGYKDGVMKAMIDIN